MSGGRPPRALRAALVALLALLLVAGLALTGCGGPSGAKTPTAAPATATHARRATLVLDFVPNAVHAGIYRALSAGYYRQAGIDLRVIQPSSTTDTLKLIDAGRADFGLADGSDVASQIAAGGDAKAILALVQRPLGGLIALANEHLTSPRQLQGRTVGITGVPSDSAVLGTVVRFAGGNPRRVHVVTVGFNGATALVGRRVAAFTGFWPDDGVGLQVAGHPITVFALDAYGGPAYPGLVAFTTERLIARDPALVRAFVAATVRGYRDTLRDSAASLAALLRYNPGLPRALTAASLRTYLRLFADHSGAFGALDAARVTAMSSWMVANGLIHHAIPAPRYGTNAFLPGRQAGAR
jgi:NitT/TauT family transport system substrate-binding protein/putative hydroxymethylpyrimidine transport system substrate-binding protein